MKNFLRNHYFAVFVILSFSIHVMANGEWCIPVFAWIYPILFLGMLYLNHTRKVYFIIGSIYALQSIKDRDNFMVIDDREV